MASGWQPYQDPLIGRPAQFNTGLASHPQQLASKYGQPPQSQPPVGYTYETFQTPAASKPAGLNSKPVSMASSPTATPRTRDYVTDADTTMEDADPYNRAKYPSRPNHHSRASSQFLAQAEESPSSSAARRYSPMNILSSPMSYPTSPGKSQASYGFPPTASAQSRRSPVRAADYSSPPLGYQSPPCEFLFSFSRPPSACSLMIFDSKPPPSTSSPPGGRSQSRSILPSLCFLPHGWRFWPGIAISAIGILAIPGPRPRTRSQVPEDQVRAGASAPGPCAACLPARQPGRRFHQRTLSLASLPGPMLNFTLFHSPSMP